MSLIPVTWQGLLTVSKPDTFAAPPLCPGPHHRGDHTYTPSFEI